MGILNADGNVQLGNSGTAGQNSHIRKTNTTTGDFIVSNGNQGAPIKDLLKADVNGNVTVGNSVTFPDGSQLMTSAYSYSNRNRIINGDFRISQYNGATAVTPAASAYVIDRWEYIASQASKLSFQQVADAPVGAKYSAKFAVTAQYAPLTADQFYLTQKIEGQNIIDFAWGTTGALSITTSFWIKTSVAGNYSVGIFNGSANRSYVATYNIPTANVWTQLKLTISGDQTGTWATDNTIGLYLLFSLGTGSTYTTATTNAWQAGTFEKASGSLDFVNQTVGSTWQLANVQLEAGTVATPFELRPIGTELALCQRYAEAPSINSSSYGATGYTPVNSLARTGASFRVAKRVAPSFAFIGTGSAASFNVNGSGVNVAGVTVSTMTSVDGAAIDIAVAGTPFTVGQGCSVSVASGASLFVAEL